MKKENIKIVANHKSQVRATNNKGPWGETWIAIILFINLQCSSWTEI